MIFVDVESDGLLQEATKAHCCSFRDSLDSSEVLIVGHDNVKNKLLALVDSKETICGQNFFTFDNELFKKLYSIDLTKANKVIDTLVMSQVLCADLKDQDFKKFKGKVPPNLIGSHSLKAWGYRLDCHKGDYQGGFEEYNEEMGLYCSQDTLTTKALYEYLESLIEERTYK